MKKSWASRSARLDRIVRNDEAASSNLALSTFFHYPDCQKLYENEELIEDIWANTDEEYLDEGYPKKTMEHLDRIEEPSTKPTGENNLE